MGTTTTRKPKLKPPQALKIARDEQAYRDAKLAFEQAKADRDATRALYKHLLPLGQLVLVAGVRIKRRLKSSGRKFRLSDYLNAGNKVTKDMHPFVSEPTKYEDWTVTTGEEKT